MINSRSQFVINFFSCFTRATSRQANVFFNQTSNQLQNSNSRIKKLNNKKQLLERQNRIVSSDNNQIIDNSRIFQKNNTNSDNELDNIDQFNDIVSQNNNFNADEIASQKKSRTLFYTLQNNVVDILFNDRSRRNAVNKSDYKKLQIQYLMFKNKTLKLRLNVVEKNLSNIDYRREYNNDYYRHNTKRTNKFKKFKIQFVINYNNLIN